MGNESQGGNVRIVPRLGPGHLMARGVILCLLAAIVGIGLLVSLPPFIHLQTKGIKADVPVVEVLRTGTHVSIIVVEINGERVQMELSSMGTMKVGDSVSVVYDPGNPRNIKPRDDSILGIVVAVAVFVIVLPWGISDVYRANRKRVRQVR